MLRYSLAFAFIACVQFNFAQLTRDLTYVAHPEISSSKIKITPTQNEVNELITAQNNYELGKGIYPVGTILKRNINLFNQLKWTEKENGDRTGKSEIHLPNSTALNLLFNQFYLPLDCKLMIYSPEQTQQFGPYTFSDNKESGSFSTGLIEGQGMILELFVPKHVRQDPILMISEVVMELDHRATKGNRDFGDSEDCQVNSICNEGDNWRDQINSVVRIQLRVGNFLGWCSGTIVNNTKQDCSPYILTADHCRQTDGNIANATDYKDWEFYFKYESKKCSNPKSENDVTNVKLTGCRYLASSEKQGDGDSDFLLLELDDVIPQFYTPFFAGWDAQKEAPQNGVMIHHPKGDIKKISTYTRAAESTEWDASRKGSHWGIHWSKTNNGFGVSEGGSSGSALFNESKRVVGQLTGGSSACTEGDGKGPNNPDFFGKFDWGFFGIVEDSSKNLRYWLDKSRSARTWLDGIKWPCSEPSLSVNNAINNSFQFKVYPNPTHTTLQLEIEHIDTNSEVQILNMLGAQVFKQKINSRLSTLNISDLPNGVYSVLVKNNLGIQQQKITKY